MLFDMRPARLSARRDLTAVRPPPPPARLAAEKQKHTHTELR